MLDTYEEQSGFRPENESDIMLRLRVLAGELYQEKAHAEYILRQMFPSTATGEYLDAHASQRGIVRKGATYAVGRVIFSAGTQEHEDILIPAGTEVCTTGDMRRFVTESDAVLPSGNRDQSVDVTAVQPGSAYNVKIGSIGIIVTPVMGIVSVSNNTKFSGGSDVESDASLRERIIDSYRNLSNGANAAYYRSLALSVDGVYSASAVGCVRGAGTVNVYACGKASTLPAAKLQEIQALLDEKRELNVDVRVYSPTVVSVNLYIRLDVQDGYDFTTVAENVRTAVTEYINSLGIGHDVLLSNVGEVIYHLEGVAGYKFLESYGSDREVTDQHYAAAGTILVRDE